MDSSNEEEDRLITEEGQVVDKEAERETKRRKTEPLSNIPSASEIIQLKETENILKSSLFSLEVCHPHLSLFDLNSFFQIAELLKEARVPSKKQQSIESGLLTIKELIDSIPTKQVDQSFKKKYPG